MNPGVQVWRHGLHLSQAARLHTGYVVVSSDEHCRVPQLQSGAAGGQSSWRELLQRFWDELEQTTASASARDRMEVQAALDAALGPLIFPSQVAALDGVQVPHTAVLTHQCHASPHKACRRTPAPPAQEPAQLHSCYSHLHSS